MNGEKVPYLRILVIPSHIFFVCFGSISGEFDQAILYTHGESTKPYMLLEHTKRYVKVFTVPKFGQVTLMLWRFQDSNLISQAIVAIDTVSDWLLSNLGTLNLYIIHLEL